MTQHLPKILIADDNPLSLSFFKEALETLGVQSVGVENGELAIHYACAQNFDAMLLDRNMPKWDGLATLREIRANPRHASARSTAIATSAHLDSGQCALLLEAGFAEVLIKPVSIEQLKALLQRHLPGWQVPTSESAFLRDTTFCDDELLSDTQALITVGGDASILRALRSLFAQELENVRQELPIELAGERYDAIRERLHRLFASTGFCGANGLRKAIEQLQTALNVNPPASVPLIHQCIDEFMSICDRTRMAIVEGAK